LPIVRGLESVEIRHDHIHQDQIRYFALCDFDASGSIFGGDRLMSQFLDDAFQAD
jgi:hypothetical protein